MSNIKLIENIGKHRTFDLEVDHRDHQFYLANGVLTSNSHSVSYAIDSYYAAWLHTHYEKHWLATILQSASSNPKELAKIISEVKTQGYKISRVDINYSGIEWHYSEEAQAFVPPLTSVKGIGMGAAQEIMQNRPYLNLKNLLYSDDGKWKLSKINKTALTALCQIEGFASLEDLKNGSIKNHKALLCILTDDKNYDKLKKNIYGLTVTQIKKSIKDGLSLIDYIDILKEKYQDTEDYAREEKLLLYFNYTSSADADILFPAATMSKIEEKGVIPVHDIPENVEGIGWGCLSSVETKKTKTGKIFSRCKVIDNNFRETWIRVWGDASHLHLYTIWLIKAQNDPQWGFSSSIAKMKRIV